MSTAALPGRGGFAALLAVSLGSLTMAIALAVSIGEMRIPLPTVGLSLARHLGFSQVEVSRIQDSVIWDLPLSRALVAALC